MNPLDAVIGELESLVANTLGGLVAPIRIGYFASLYLRVTCTIRERMGTGYFDDDARMERLDAAFAARYLAAVKAFMSHEPTLEAGWATALQATGESSLLVVQQLLLSMNPHINLDLAQAAVDTCPGPLLAPLHDDFMKITAVLEGIIPTTVSEIGSLSPLIGMLNYFDEHGEVEVLNFGMSEARNAAWAWATRLNVLPPNGRQGEISIMNQAIAALGQKIRDPGFVLGRAVDFVKSFESNDAAAIIGVLNSGNPTLVLP